MSAIRVLFVSKPYVSRPYREKLRLLAKDRRFEAVGLICPTRWGSQTFEPPDADEAALLQITSLPIIFQDKNHFHLYRGLTEVARRFRPQLICVEEEDYSLVTWQTVCLSRQLGVKVMFYAWQNIEKRYPWPFCSIQQFVYRHASAAMGGSENAGRILRRKGFIRPFSVVPQIGIDLNSFDIGRDVASAKKAAKSALGISQEIQVLYFAGRIVEEKGVQTVLTAISLLNDKNCVFLCLGSGPFLPKLQSIARQLGVADQVRFIPYVSSSEVHRYAKAADIVCLASQTKPNWKEQGPVRVVTESLAAGAVAVVSDSGELPNVVGEVGMIFPEGNARKLADCIKQLGKSPSLMQSLSEAGRELVVKRYSAEAVAARSADFIFAIAGN
jgi:glycosyltransferase involved in cell wall biosynthesis